MALHTVRQAARRLGIGYSTLKLWIGRGYARTTKTAGGHHRMADAEIERLASQQDPGAKRAAPRRDTPDHLADLSARNQLRGFVEEVRVEGLLGQIRIRVGDQQLTSVITRDAIDALGIRRGDDVLAIVKSTEVMIAKPLTQAAAQSRPRSRKQAARNKRKI